MKSNWQPIETAPQDGRMVLVCLPRQMNLVVRAKYNTIHKYWKTDLTSTGITTPAFFHEGDLWHEIPEVPNSHPVTTRKDEGMIDLIFTFLGGFIFGGIIGIFMGKEKL